MKHWIRGPVGGVTYFWLKLAAIVILLILIICLLWLKWPGLITFFK